jgi:hypothetical protein
MQCKPVSEWKQDQQLANRYNLIDFDENNSHFLPIGNISTFKRRFYSIQRAEWNARQFQRENKPDSSQTATS